MPSSTTEQLQPRRTAARRPGRRLSPRLLTAPLFVVLALAAVGNLLTSSDARERFAAFAISH